MSVSIAVQHAEVAQAVPVAKPLPVLAKALPKITQLHQSIAAPPIKKVAELATPPVAAAAAVAVSALSKHEVASPTAAAVMQDSEPDYQARYLNNPRPAYPIVARRMGWQGRVILNVEVLSEGGCGSVNLYRGSGHEVLDNAAINTVKSWRFIPARHAGGAVTQWFKVPVNFSLEDNAA
jgi:protein TonB